MKKKAKYRLLKQRHDRLVGYLGDFLSYLSDNAGETEDWNLDLIARDPKSARIVNRLLRRLYREVEN